ncbi:MAG: hypothetical protein LBU60_04250 [Clostridiales bacterium]|jgi:acyl-ACP thioesterase|nr:hypothetical protein [Clostridiales bacterium]
MYKYQTRIGISKTRADGKMSVWALFDAIGDCEQFQIDSDMLLFNYLKSNNFGMYLTSRYAQILTMPSYGDEITICTSIYEVQNLFGFRNTFVYDMHNNILVKTYAMGAFVDLLKNKLTKLDSDFLASYPLEPKLDMEYSPRKVECKGEPIHCGQVLVPYWYLDSYGHTNNVRYIQKATDYLDNSSAIKSVKVEFKNSSHLGDCMFVNKYVHDDVTVIQFYNGSKIYANVEFIKACH